MENIYSVIDDIIKTKFDKRNRYNTLREVARKLESIALYPDEYQRLIRYATDRLGL